MDSPDFLKWFFSEAGAGWLVAFVALVGLISTLLRRKRPNKLLCKEIDQISLVNISYKVRGRIVVLFDNKPVGKLSQVQLEILNKGSEVIKNISLKLKFKEGTKILSTSFDPIPESLEVHAKSIGDEQILIKIPFLNPIHLHNHRIIANIVCDGETKYFEMIGSGEGWSVETLRLPSAKQLAKKKRNGILNGILIFEVFLMFFIYIPFIERLSGNPPSIFLFPVLPILIMFWTIIIDYSTR